jgi:hypothetical protein
MTGSLISFVLNVAAQTHLSTTSTATTGSIEGRVLGITRDGDLKPARVPNIYLLYEGHRSGHVDPSSAEEHYTKVSLEAIGKQLNAKGELLARGLTGDEGLECRRSLLDIDQNLLDTQQWALDNKKIKQVLTAQGDEEGYFKITRVPAGNYRIVARGHAGANDAFWESLFVVVKSETSTSLKLIKPGKSCLIVE